jgi:hypothetical protein
VLLDVWVMMAKIIFSFVRTAYLEVGEPPLVGCPRHLIEHIRSCPLDALRQFI